MTKPQDPAALASHIVAGTPDGVIAADAAGMSTLWNDGAARIFGFTSAEALEASLDLIIPENLRERHREGYRRVMATGETKYGTRLLATPALRKDGTRISIEFSLALLRDSDGTMRGTAAIMRDVTERWQKEQDLKSRLAACETARREQEQP